jgi:uncharacterized iron-regulated membrane protein
MFISPCLPNKAIVANYLLNVNIMDVPVEFRVRMPDEFFAFNWVWVNPYTGEVMKTYDASTENLAYRIWNFKYNFHTGSFFDISLKFFWILLALLPAAFAITGLWLFIKRTQRNRPMRVTT